MIQLLALILKPGITIRHVNKVINHLLTRAETNNPGLAQPKVPIHTVMRKEKLLGLATTLGIISYTAKRTVLP